MKYSPKGPYRAGEEPRADEASEQIEHPENVTNLRDYRERKVVQRILDATTGLTDNHPAGRRGRKTARQTLKDLGIEHPDGDEPA